MVNGVGEDKGICGIPGGEKTTFPLPIKKFL